MSIVHTNMIHCEYSATGALVILFQFLYFTVVIKEDSRSKCKEKIVENPLPIPKTYRASRDQPIEIKIISTIG